VKIKDLSVPEVELILERNYFNILTLLLVGNNSNDIKLQINSEKYPYIDPRKIFINKYTENPEEIEKEIEPRILRFFSIHNELGDRFTIDGKEYDLIGYYFPFYFNIACVGKEGCGKSTCINEILQEYKSKEYFGKKSILKEKPFYYDSKLPIRILEIDTTD
jgi:ribosome biogenesis GTPase A